MPFKRFPGDDGEAQSFPVSFGPSASTVANGNAPNLLEKAVDAGSNLDDGLSSWHSLARSRSPLRTSGAARASSPSPSLPLMDSSSFSPPVSLKSRENDQAVQTEPAYLRTRLSSAAMGKSSQKSLAFINSSDRGRVSSKFHAQDERNLISRPARTLPETASYRVSNSQGIQSTFGMRNSPPHETASRLHASALQQLRPIEGGSAVSLSVEQQRDEMARGRRLRRFNDPFAKGTITGFNIETKAAVDQGATKQDKGVGKAVSMMTRDDAQGDLTESEAPDGLAERDWQSAEPILGDCPDMCPESERLERERKGDLDRLERVDGDRNQTSRHLAVKKYTRTAEKQASLIRPISVLLTTMKHLLHLLDREYDEELLNLHNFLWDRMRAIRMDLRMQHIFNEQAVVMHEQMIRFHILAMHELCEYAKGEGFSEGFDAHLNIEQMNKASVDLFHMYDDLRKSGQICTSEAEFRGYYALLKLDKHPGYVVEPAALSLDLAKMTPEMRNAPEVQFARKVARACRSGNYLAFFSLARDATYLQACLMHAHFSKLRSQAMAFLHSGLQRNQGIPIVQLEDWLGMEGEDIEVLLEHHGFALRNYEELYMVKEGPFLNQHKPIRTRRSKLVEGKRSLTIKDDVLFSGQGKVSTLPFLERVSSFRRQSELQSPTELTQTDEEMPDYEEVQQQETSSLPMVSSRSQRDEHLVDIQGPIATYLAPDILVQKSVQASLVDGKSDDNEEDNRLQIAKRRKFFPPSIESPKVVTPTEYATTPRDKKLSTFQAVPSILSSQVTVLAEVKPHLVYDDNLCEKKTETHSALKAEVDLVKARYMLRKWRARVASKVEERQWRQQKLEAALGLFNVGLPMQDVKKGSIYRSLAANAVELDLVEVEDERSKKN